MIHEISPWRLRNEYDPCLPGPGDLVIDVDTGGILTRHEGMICLPRVEEWKTWQKEQARLLYAFRLENTDTGECQRIFLPLRPRGTPVPLPHDWTRLPAMDFRDKEPSHLSYAVATAGHLHRWYATTRFCGTCGHELYHSDRERCMVCPACGAMKYPRIAPCVIVAVTDGERLLMTRYAHGNNTRYVLVAGFIEIGETGEEAAAREVMEETGIRIKNIRYQGSQPWGFSGTLAMGFTAELDGPASLHVDTSELSEARWIHRKDIPVYPGHSSLTMNLVQRFARGEY